MKTRLFACCTILYIALAGRHARAETTPEEDARRHYERGLAFYEDAAYDSALVELMRAYELRPAPILLYNIALVHRARNDYAAALQAFRKYMAQTGASDPHRGEVRAEIEELEQRVAEVMIHVDVAGAEILIDHHLVGTSPLREALLVNSGVRLLTVQRAGHPAQNRELRLAGRDSVELNITLGAGSVVASAQDVPQGAASEQRSRRRRGLWISWGLTGALAAGALGCGVAALTTEARLRDRRGQLGPDPDALEADSKKTTRLAIATDVLLVSTLGAGAFALWWTLRDDSAAQEPRSAAMNLRLLPSGMLLSAHY